MHTGAYKAPYLHGRVEEDGGRAVRVEVDGLEALLLSRLCILGIGIGIRYWYYRYWYLCSTTSIKALLFSRLHPHTPEATIPPSPRKQHPLSSASDLINLANGQAVCARACQSARARVCLRRSEGARATWSELALVCVCVRVCVCCYVFLPCAMGLRQAGTAARTMYITIAASP